MLTSRRSFLAGLASALTAPAIVHAGNLMPMKVMAPVYCDPWPFPDHIWIRFYPTVYASLQDEVNRRQSRVLRALAARPGLMVPRILNAPRMPEATIGTFEGVRFIDAETPR